MKFEMRKVWPLILGVFLPLLLITIGATHVECMGKLENENESCLSEISTISAAPLPKRFGAGKVLGFTPFANQDRIGRLAHEAGVAWTLEDFAWHNIETRPGFYDFTNQDRFVNNDIKYGLQILGNIAFTPRFYSSNPYAPNYYIYATTSSEGLNAWSMFVTETVNRYKDHVHHWLIWPNVDDYEYWQPVPGVNEYKALLQNAYTAIKNADSTAIVVMAASDPTFLNALLDAGGGDYFDAIAVHNYANPFAPEVSTLTTLRLAALHNLALRRADGKTLWVTEYGWPTYPGDIGVDRETQAAYLIRSLLLQSACPYVANIIWTDFQDRTVGGAYEPNDPADNYGMLLDINGSKKISFDAFNAMTSTLTDARLVRCKRSKAVSFQIIEDFESTQQYEVFTGGGASGSFSKADIPAYAGYYSGRIDYQFSQEINSAVVIAPSPDLFLPISITATRFSVRARGDGGPAPMLTVRFQDATGERFEAIIGLVGGTDWCEHVYYLDSPKGTASTLLTDGEGDNDQVIDYPIRFTGIGVHFWSVASPVTNGTVYIDDLKFESGPSVFDCIYRNPSEIVHAIWSLSGFPQIDILIGSVSALARDWHNNTSVIMANNGQVTLLANEHPTFVLFPAVFGDTTGLFRPSNGHFFLKNQNTSGFADTTLTYGVPRDRPLSGDWDGDRIDTIAVYRNGAFYMTNSNTDGFADIVFAFGLVTDQPLAGDWDGDGVDTVGVYRNGIFYLRNSNNSGPPDIVFALGNSGDIPIAGDWTGKGYDTVGVFRPTNGALYLKNTHGGGFADIVLTYGLPGDKPVGGDWDGDGVDSIGVFRNGSFYLRNSNTNGFADIVFYVGTREDEPISGNWTGRP